MDDILTPLAKKHGTDKFGAHFYTKHYNNHFAHLRDMPIRLLEIGIGGYDDPNAGGESLRMWKEYFPHGLIFGLDIHQKNMKESRIVTYKGSQADPVILASMIKDVGAFDIIIDDGSHSNEHVIATFIMLFQYLSNDGIYVVEDLQTSYWSRCGGNSYDLNSGLTSMSFFKNLVDGLNWQEIHRPGYASTFFDRNIISMSFYHNLLFIQKGNNNEGSNYAVNSRVPDQC